MPSTTESNYLSDLLLHEVHGITRDKVTLTAGSYAMGTVLARVSGKYLPIDPAGTGAAKVGRAVLAEAVDASAADKPGVVIARNAAVDASYLIWPSGITDTAKATALDDLDARGIVARTTL